MQHGMTIGSDARNAVRTEGEGVQPLHARVLRNDCGVLELVCENPAASVLDCGSGHESIRVVLDEGARVMLGNTLLICHGLSSASAAPTVSAVPNLAVVAGEVGVLQSSQQEPTTSAEAEKIQTLSSKGAPAAEGKFELSQESVTRSKSNLQTVKKRALAVLAVMVVGIAGYFSVSGLFRPHDADSQYKLDKDYTSKGDHADAAVESHRKAAEQGHAEAQFNLGKCLAEGTGVTKNEAEAVTWYRKAAEQGNADGQTALGSSYFYGGGVQQDYNEAAKWYRKAANQGHASAQDFLGLMYGLGFGVTQDDGESYTWYRKAAEQGHAGAQTSLGLLCGKSDYDFEAVKWFKKAAEQGDAHAQYLLGRCYDDGEGVPRDGSEAVNWFLKAAEKGNAEAQYKLAYCYDNGNGVERNQVESVKWLRKAAEQGDPQAQWELGLRYVNGRGLAQDAAEAVNWFLKAAELGHDNAMYDLAQCYLQGKGVAKNEAEGNKWLQKTKVQEATFGLSDQAKVEFVDAAKQMIADDTSGDNGQDQRDTFINELQIAAMQGKAQAQYDLGIRLAEGNGVGKDEADAVKWIRKAAEQGLAEAQFKLAGFYVAGTGVESNADEAYRLYMEAAKQGHKEQFYAGCRGI